MTAAATSITQNATPIKSDEVIEKEFLNLLTPVEPEVDGGIKLNNTQIDHKLKFLLERLEQSMLILKINYWGQIAKLTQNSDNYTSGYEFLNAHGDSISDNLLHHMQTVYDIQKLRSEYAYIKRNNIEYALNY